MDDAYLGGERSGGKRGRGSPGKTLFLAAVETTKDGKAHRVKLRRVRRFTKKNIQKVTGRIATPGAASLLLTKCGYGPDSDGPAESCDELPPPYGHSITSLKGWWQQDSSYPCSSHKHSSNVAPQSPLADEGRFGSRADLPTEVRLARSWSVVPSISAVVAPAESTHPMCQKRP
jgi:hypothetical protein